MIEWANALQSRVAWQLGKLQITSSDTEAEGF